MSYKKIQIKRATLIQIWLREPLEIQTTQPTNNFKWTTEFVHIGNELYLYKLITVIRHTLAYS